MSFNLVLMEDTNGEKVPSYNEKGEVLIHDESDDSYTQLQVIQEPMDINNAAEDGKLKAHWTYEATILLINKYKYFQPYFADSIHKNVEVWDAIANEFRKDGYSFCGGQCENRWKYIRAKYLKKKDNGGPGSTGDELYQFEYYKEMDEVLGKKPNVVPRYLASSESSPRSNTTPNTNIQAPKTNIRAPKRSLLSAARGRSSSGGVNLTSLPRLGIESSSNSQSSSSSNSQSSSSSPNADKTRGKRRKEPWDENVDRQERYHQEMMQVQRDSNNLMKDFMSQILECFRRT